MEKERSVSVCEMFAERKKEKRKGEEVGDNDDAKEERGKSG